MSAILIFSGEDTEMTLKATGVLISTFMKFPLKLPFPHHIKINLQLSYRNITGSSNLSRWANLGNVFLE